MTDTTPITCGVDGRAHPVSDREDGAVLLTWITLNRAAEGSVTQQDDRFLDWGAPLPPDLAVPLTTLITEGLLALADPEPTGCRRVTVTEAGRVRHDQLLRRTARGVDQ